MSAYVVSKEHIDVMVREAITRRDFYVYMDGKSDRASVANADAIGRMLWAANMEAVEQRYPDVVTVPESAGGRGYPGPIGFTPEWVRDYSFTPMSDPRSFVIGGGFTPSDLTPVEVLKMLGAYTYQCEDSTEWVGSDAANFCERLTYDAITRLPGWEEAQRDY